MGLCRQHQVNHPQLKKPLAISGGTLVFQRTLGWEWLINSYQRLRKWLNLAFIGQLLDPFHSLAPSVKQKKWRNIWKLGVYRWSLRSVSLGDTEMKMAELHRKGKFQADRKIHSWNTYLAYLVKYLKVWSASLVIQAPLPDSRPGSRSLLRLICVWSTFVIR